jgi:16S rRNA (guanine(527)-N(7))-methyltransferase RsmG
MKELLDAADLRLDATAFDRLWAYHELLRRRNHDRDLTRIVAFRSMVIKHYIDCMLVGTLVELPSPLLDVGTGAGFPGIPLAIQNPSLSIVLAEPRPRRVEFLHEVIAALGLRSVEVFPHRVVSASFRRPVRGTITRALETMDKTLLRTSGCVRAGTRQVFMKGPAVDPELELVRTRLSADVRVVQDIRYRLIDPEHERRLVVLERLRDPVDQAGADAELEDPEPGDPEG